MTTRRLAALAFIDTGDSEKLEHDIAMLSKLNGETVMAWRESVLETVKVFRGYRARAERNKKREKDREDKRYRRSTNARAAAAKRKAVSDSGDVQQPRRAIPRRQPDVAFSSRESRLSDQMAIEAEARQGLFKRPGGAANNPT